MKAAMVGLAVLASMFAAMGATATTSARQQIAIEEKVTAALGGAGTFRLIPLGPGPLKADSGSFTFNGGFAGASVVGGQNVRRYFGVDELEGKQGSLRIRATSTSTEAGFGYQAGASTWKIVAGTGAYADISGRGRGTIVATPSRTAISRYEGYVTLS